MAAAAWTVNGPVRRAELMTRQSRNSTHPHTSQPGKLVRVYRTRWPAPGWAAHARRAPLTAIDAPGRAVTPRWAVVQSLDPQVPDCVAQIAAWPRPHSEPEPDRAAMIPAAVTASSRLPKIAVTLPRGSVSFRRCVVVI